MQESHIKNPQTLSLMKAILTSPEMFILETEAEKFQEPDVFEKTLSLRWE